MAPHPLKVGMQLIDWPSQIRAELHEPINGCDSSGSAGSLRSNPHGLFSPPVLRVTFHCISAPRLLLGSAIGASEGLCVIRAVEGRQWVRAGEAVGCGEAAVRGDDGDNWWEEEEDKLDVLRVADNLPVDTDTNDFTRV